MHLSNNRIEYLDSLRGLAALSVLFSHFYLAFGLPVPGLSSNYFINSPFHIVWDGAAAVSLFFVLSGYVLSLKYLQNISTELKQEDIIHFYIARFFRILPPFLAVLLLSYWSYNYLWQQYETIPAVKEWLYAEWSASSKVSDSSLFMQALLLLPNTKHFYIPQGWTLTLEIQISLLMPFLIIWAKKNINSLLIVMLAGIMYETLYNESFMFTIYMIVLFHFVLGICIAKYFMLTKKMSDHYNLSSRLIFWIIAIAFYGFRFNVHAWFPDSIDENRIWYMSAIGSFLIILLTLTSKNVKIILNYALLRFLGKISYSIYLTHFLILIICSPWIINILNKHSDLNEAETYFTSLLITVLVTLLTSIIIYFLVEKTSIKSGKLLFKYISK